MNYLAPERRGIPAGKFFRQMYSRRRAARHLYAEIITILVLFSVFYYLLSDSVQAYVMSSSNYWIKSDSINVGGAREGSASYRMEDTIGEIASDESASASYKLKAGYQQMQEVYIAISAPSDVTMTPAIGGVSGGTGNGSASWTVITDSPAGYTLSIKASTSPGMQSGANSFADYTPAVAGTPDYSWLIAGVDSEFGLTPEGSHIVQKFKDNGSACNTGSSDTADKCWYNFSTSDENIANSSASNHPAGTATAAKFRAESGASHLQVEGTYQATITATAVAN